MPIRFACPKPLCGARYTVPDARAGKVAVCANLSCRTRVRVPPPPPPPVEGVLIDEETGAAVRDWRDDYEPPPPEPSPAWEPAPAFTGVRCYDCGCDVPEGELVRRNVAVGWSSWSGSTSWSGPYPAERGSHDGSSTSYGRVDLCLACSRGRDRLARLKFVVMLVVVALVLIVMG
jgi:hypothetical protein